MISLVKNLECISRLNIHGYLNRRYKSDITSLKAVIVGKYLISVGLDIERTLYFVFYNKILKICRQHWVKKFYRHIWQNTDKFQKSVCGREAECSTSPDRHALMTKILVAISKISKYYYHDCSIIFIKTVYLKHHII